MKVPMIALAGTLMILGVRSQMSVRTAPGCRLFTVTPAEATSHEQP